MPHAAMSFRKPCHMPFRKLIPPFILTGFSGILYGEGKRRNEFVQWHVAWFAEGHNYAECKIWKFAQRNKLN